MDGLLSREVVDPAEQRQPDSATVTATFTRHNLGKVCTLVRSTGVRADVAPEDMEDLLIAVSEIVINAIRYAGGVGTITLRPDTVGLFVEICDNGPGLPDGWATGQLFGHASGGGGLWLARVLSKDFDVVSSQRGVTVRMFAPCKTPRRRPNTSPQRLPETPSEEPARLRVYRSAGVQSMAVTACSQIR